MQSPPTVLCDYCGQLFDTRKALSCHARAHLRHLGLAWSIRTSPIDLLKEVMIHGVESVKESAASGSSAKAALSPQGSRKSLDSLHSGEPDTKSCTSPLNYSLKEKSPSVKSAAPHPGETFSFNLSERQTLQDQELVFHILVLTGKVTRSTSSFSVELGVLIRCTIKGSYQSKWGRK